MTYESSRTVSWRCSAGSWSVCSVTAVFHSDFWSTSETVKRNELLILMNLTKITVCTVAALRCANKHQNMDDIHVHANKALWIELNYSLTSLKQAKMCLILYSGDFWTQIINSNPQIRSFKSRNKHKLFIFKFLICDTCWALYVCDINGYIFVKSSFDPDVCIFICYLFYELFCLYFDGEYSWGDSKLRKFTIYFSLFLNNLNKYIHFQITNDIKWNNMMKNIRI